MSRDPWRNFRYRLDSFESGLKALSYSGAFEPPPADSHNSWNFRDLPEGGITPEQIANILSEKAVGAPHGLQLLDPVQIPVIPAVPDYPDEPRPDYPAPAPSALARFFGASSATKSPAPPTVHAPPYIIERAERLKLRRDELSKAFQSKFTEEHQKLERLRQHCAAGEPEAINALMKLSHIRHPLPPPLLRAFEIDLDCSARVILGSIEIPDFAGLSIVRKRGTSYQAKWQPVSATERRRSVETILYALCLRAAYLTANSDVANVFDTVAVNATQSWHDPATGKPCQGIIASLQAPKADLLQLHIGQLDAKACFRHLKGITTPSVDQISPVRPIFVMNTNDRRIIENRDVAEQLDREANLATMPWEDFEHLVRQLFEWEFGRNGVEVKVTRASRDRGVDAIMFDPDPLRAGKYVLQAKRYTRPVDVAAVRDLYGTVVNEGANRGILVTTSSYGPDSYEFAKDKPISLVDGPNLITMLRQHGRRFRIDLEEARRLGQ